MNKGYEQNASLMSWKRQAAGVKAGVCFYSIPTMILVTKKERQQEPK
jgi:hypothetical protein